MCAWQVQAQEREVEDKDDIFSMVRIDTIQFKPFSAQTLNYLATKDERDLPDFYDEEIVIYEFNSSEEETVSGLKQSNLKPTVFLLPGGGFLELSPSDTLQMSLGTNYATGFSMAKRLAAPPFNYKVVYVRYRVVPRAVTHPHTRTVFPGQRSSNPPNAQCNYTSNETGKARTLEASYISFQSFRGILQSYKLAAPGNEVDTNNIFLVGVSAGAVLSLNTLFLQQNEIPDTIKYISNCAGAIGRIPIVDSLRNKYWNLPPLKGIVTMNGAWIYDTLSYLTTNPSKVNNTSIYMIHGTCDEIINRKTGRIGFKFFSDTVYNPLLNPYNFQNNDTTSRYLSGRGSETIFNTFKASHPKITYGQVYRGGHGVFLQQGSAPATGVGAWDWKLSSDSINTPVFNEVAGFISRLVADSSDWETRAFVLDTLKIPELPTQKCLNADSTAYNSLICFATIKQPIVTQPPVICTAAERNINVQNVQQGVSYQWSVSATANLSLEAGMNTPTLTFKRKNNVNKTDTLTLTLTRPCATSVVKQYIIQTQTGTLNPQIGPTGWDVICSGNKTATLTGVTGFTPTWLVTPNLDFVSSSGSSVTYKRKNNILSTGTISAIFTTSCGVDTFSYTVYTYPTLGNWFNTFGVVSECESGIITSSPTKVPLNSQATFSTIYPNAAQMGITTLEWESDCIIGFPTETWIGNDLKSEMVLTSASVCSYIRVRPKNACSNGSWKTVNISVAPCGGGGWGLMLAPNPVSTELFVKIMHNDQDLLNKKYPVLITDEAGKDVLKTYIESANCSLNVSTLRSGVYKIFITTDTEVLTGGFVISR
jgi:predicted esterase